MPKFISNLFSIVIKTHPLHTIQVFSALTAGALYKCKRGGKSGKSAACSTADFTNLRSYYRLEDGPRLNHLSLVALVTHYILGASGSGIT